MVLQRLALVVLQHGRTRQIAGHGPHGLVATLFLPIMLRSRCVFVNASRHTNEARPFGTCSYLSSALYGQARAWALHKGRQVQAQAKVASTSQLITSTLACSLLPSPVGPTREGVALGTHAAARLP